MRGQRVLPGHPATSHARSCPQRHVHDRLRPGLTLIEILMVLALLLALGAIVFPAFTSRYRNVVFTSAAERVVSFCAEVRAEALRGGRPLIINWDQSRQRLFVEPMVSDIDETEDVSRDTGGSPAGVATDQDFELNAPEEETRLQRLTLPLEDGFRIVQGSELTGDQSETAGLQFDAGEGDPAGDPDSGEQPSWVTEESGSPLILMLQDGTALVLGGDFGMQDAHGRLVRYEVDTWSGRVAWHEVIRTIEGTGSDSMGRSSDTNQAEDH